MAKQKNAGDVAPKLFQPQSLRWEDVDWSSIAQRQDFQMLGLCNRHVEIDQTGRDWHGMPYMVDEVAAPAQGIPYVMPFKTHDEIELNAHLWQLEFLGRDIHHVSTERAYARYVAEQPPGVRLWTIEQFHLRQVYQKVRLHILPSPRIARYYIKHWTPEQYAEADRYEEENSHQRVATPMEKFTQLNYVGRVIFALEGLIESCRQRIVFASLQHEHHTEQLLKLGMKTASSQEHWARVDTQREQERKQRILLKRQNQQVVAAPMAEQTTLF